jgi:hypothetical protein
MCRFWAGGISSFPFSRAREYRLLRRLLFILIYINFGKFKLEKAPNFVTRPASNVERRSEARKNAECTYQ